MKTKTLGMSSDESSNEVDILMIFLMIFLLFYCFHWIGVKVPEHF